jgi:TorA maturation chaperone TorD
MNPLAELRAYLASFAARCRAARWLGALFHCGVIEKIVADVAQTEADAAQLNYSAEQEDREAAKIVRAALADGKVTPDELPSLRRAVRLIDASAAHDRAASELLTPERA